MSGTIVSLIAVGSYLAGAATRVLWRVVKLSDENTRLKTENELLKRRY